jgi:hypothetical protein
MKTNNIPGKAEITARQNKKRDTRDDLDSRKNEEYDIKGDTVTHHKKETKAGKKKYGHQD